MKNKALNYLKLLFSGIFLFWSCAIIKNPEGGPKDLKPPKIVKEYPPNYSKNFQSKKILISFNKLIQAPNIKKTIIITPLLNQSPDFVLKNNKLIITLKDTLKNNTTYSINFGSAILDYNEGNILRNYSYVFSTGNKLDTAEINGKVIDMETQQPLPGLKIMLINENCDSCLYKFKPAYYNVSDSSGKFEIKFIKPGKYFIYALQDLNNDLRFNKGEKIAFNSDLIDLDTAIRNIKMYAFIERENKTNYSNYKIIDEKKIRINFTGNPKKIKIFQETTSGYRDLYYLSNNRNDTIIAWLYKPYRDSIRLKVEYDQKDTMIRYLSRNKEIIKNKKPAKLSINPINDLYRSQKFYISFSEPVIKINKQEVIAVQDSVKKRIKILFDFVDSSLTKASFPINFEPGQNINFIIPDSFFEGIYGSTNDTTIINVVYKKESEMGSIDVSVQVPEGKVKYIVELVDKSFSVIRTLIISKTTDIQFLNLIPDVYRVRVIRDENNNGIWDSGVIRDKKQPEQVYIYPEDIILKANWEINDLKLIIPAYSSDYFQK